MYGGFYNHTGAHSVWRFVRRNVLILGERYSSSLSTSASLSPLNRWRKTAAEEEKVTLHTCTCMHAWYWQYLISCVPVTVSVRLCPCFAGTGILCIFVYVSHFYAYTLVTSPMINFLPMWQRNFAEVKSLTSYTLTIPDVPYIRTCHSMPYVPYVHTIICWMYVPYYAGCTICT